MFQIPGEKKFQKFTWANVFSPELSNMIFTEGFLTYFHVFTFK